MSVSVIVVGFGDEPKLDSCLRAILAQIEDGDEVVLVDHGLTHLPSLERITLVTPEANTGFGGGCGAGVDASNGDVLVFVNSDAVLRPGAVAALEETVRDQAIGLAGGLVLLPGEPDIVNSIGLPVHLTGLSWCDGFGERVTPSHLVERRLASISGALFACRRSTWDSLGGMDRSYFMYHEDTDLSLRCHLAGLDVVYCPEAVAVHEYEFSRNAGKMFQLERNRALTVLGDFPASLLVRVLPVMLLLEPLYFVIAIRDGWWQEKFAAWWWVFRHGRDLKIRRRKVQSQVRATHALDSVITPTITQTQLEEPVGSTLLNQVLEHYWRLARPRHCRHAQGHGQSSRAHAATEATCKGADA